MQRKHVVFFTVVVLVAIVSLVIFQMFDDGGLKPGSPGPEQAIEAPAAPAPVDAGP